jgi:hypothetical protein
MNVGRIVGPKMIESIKTELSVFLERSDESLVVPYLPFSRHIIELLKGDPINAYLAMPEPAGKRCLLYLRGHDRYFIGDGNFIRQIDLYLPQSENGTQQLNSAIVEGILARSSDDSSRCRFYISDLHRFDGDDYRRRPYEFRLGIAFSHILRMREEQGKKGVFPESFRGDSCGIRIRPYLRLKYVDTIIDNPLQYVAVKTQGIVLGRKSSILGSSLFAIWTGPIQDPVHVKVVIDRVRGMVSGSVAEGENVVDFGPLGPLWSALEGKTVEIRLRGEERLWELKGLASSEGPLTKEVFWKRVETPNLYTEIDLKRDISEIVKLPCYVDEEIAKVQGRR